MYTLMKPVGAGALGGEFPLPEHGPAQPHMPQPPPAEGNHRFATCNLPYDQLQRWADKKNHNQTSRTMILLSNRVDMA